MASATTNWRAPNSPESRDAWRPSLPATLAHTRRCDARRARSIPLQRPLLPDVDEADEQNQHEHQHLAEPEERDVSDGTDVVHERDEAGQLLEVHRPRNHEHRFDVENDEQDRDEVESNREALSRVAQSRNARLIRLLLYRRWPRPDRKRGDDYDRQPVDSHETEEHQDREIRAKHDLSDFVKNFTSVNFGIYLWQSSNSTASVEWRCQCENRTFSSKTCELEPPRRTDDSGAPPASPFPLPASLACQFNRIPASPACRQITGWTT